MYNTRESISYVFLWVKYWNRLFFCQYLHHILILKRIIKLLIIFTCSDSSNDCHFRKIWVIFSHFLFCLLYEFLPETNMLPGIITPESHWNLVSENMHLPNNSRIIKNRKKVMFSWEYLGWNPEAKKSKNSPIMRINHLKKPLMSAACLIKIFLKNSILRKISFCSNLPRRDIMTNEFSFVHLNLCHLSQISNLGSCENLFCRYITVHTIQSNIFWNHWLKLCHKRDQYIIGIGDKLARSPYFLQFRMWSYDQWIQLELIRTKPGILKNFSHRILIKHGCWSIESRHEMCHHFETSIFE